LEEDAGLSIANGATTTNTCENEPGGTATNIIASPSAIDTTDLMSFSLGDQTRTTYPHKKRTDQMGQDLQASIW